MKIDKYQQRYLIHQQHKKIQLQSNYGLNIKGKGDKTMQDFYIQLLKNRRSQRLYNSEPVTDEEINFLLSCAVESPSSCNRQAVNLKMIDKRDEKELLAGILVGGVGWCHRADKILLIFGQKIAYKENLDYMPFLDAGVLIFNIYLACEALGLGCCFINPNIRADNISIFQKRFGDNIFCGAIAIGHYERKSEYTTKINKKEILI